MRAKKRERERERERKRERERERKRGGGGNQHTIPSVFIQGACSEATKKKQNMEEQF